MAERFLDMDMSQRDQASALKAFQDFAELTRRFPTSRYTRDAQLRMTYLRNLLAQHEYQTWRITICAAGPDVAAASRARYVVEHYQRAPVMPDALILMAKAYRVLALDDLADDAIRVPQQTTRATRGSKRSGPCGLPSKFNYFLADYFLLLQ